MTTATPRTAEAVALLKTDHRQLLALLNRLSSPRPRAVAEREVRLRELVTLLSTHLALKEAWVYPLLRARVPELEGAILEALEAHHLLKWQLRELNGLSPEHPRFSAKLTQLSTVLRAHLGQEARRLHPAAQVRLSPEERALLGQQLLEARRIAPTRPHPRMSDVPPFNLVQQRLSGLVDRGRDALEAALRQGRAIWERAQELRV